MHEPAAASIPTAPARDCRAACGSTHNEAQGGWVLLAPERVFKADAIAAEILKRCTGEATLGAIVDDLAKHLQCAARAHPCRRGEAARGSLADKKLLEL